MKWWRDLEMSSELYSNYGSTTILLPSTSSSSSRRIPIRDSESVPIGSKETDYLLQSPVVRRTNLENNEQKMRTGERVSTVTSKMEQLMGMILVGLKSSTVEVALFFLMVSSLAVFTLSEDLALEKACRVNLGFSDDVCDSVRNRNESMATEEAAMQRLVSTVKSYHAIVDYGIPILLMLFLGPLSDAFGRKIPMLMCVMGYLLQFGGAVLSAYEVSWGLWTFKFILATTRAIGGGEASYNMAAMAYISDLTPNNLSLRTVRTGVLYSFFMAGVPVGSAFGAQLSSFNIGYVKGLALAGTPGFLSLILVLCTPNTKNLDKAKEIEGKSFCQIIRYIFHPRSTWIQIWETLVKRREGYTRFNIFAIFLAHFCVMAPLSAEFTVRYLFLRIQLHWNLTEFGHFSTFAYVIGIVGVILSMGFLSYYLRLSDPLVGFISGTSQFSSCFLYTFARTSTLMYLAPVVDMMNGTMIVVNKSILSKLVSREEVGNLFAFVGVVDSVSPLLLVPTYNALYKVTFETLPGTFYLLSAALTIPAFIVFAWLIYWDLKERGLDGWFQPRKNDPANSNQTTTTRGGVYMTPF